MSDSRFVLSLSCPNRPGIVAGLSSLLYREGCNITEAQQFDETESRTFFARIIFDCESPTDAADRISRGLADLANMIGSNWKLRSIAERKRVMVLASKLDHCLADILYRWRTQELRMDITAIASNHPRDTYQHLDLSGIPFHFLPIDKDNKKEQETKLFDLFEDSGSSLVVLARYMQILSDDLSLKLSGRCINIHHSFLPSFKGAKPYHQAHARGVKLIGATAHYVNGDLDEGPIIEQDVERISHQDTPEDLVQKGRDIERRVLARAIRWHLDDRVFLHGNKTVVLRD